MTATSRSAPELIPLAAAHVDILSVLHRAAFGPRGERVWNPAEFDDLLGLPGVAGWMAVEDGVPLGFILISRAGDEAEVLTLAVAPKTRRLGVGGHLLDRAIAVARDDGARALLLEVAEDNEAALALYKGRGFAERGRRAAYYDRAGLRVDAIILGLMD